MANEFEYLVPILKEIRQSKDQDLSRKVYNFVYGLIQTQHLNPEILSIYLDLYLEKNPQLHSIFPLSSYEAEIESSLNEIRMYNKRQAKGKASYKKELLYHCAIYKYLVIACHADFSMDLLETYSSSSKQDLELKETILNTLHNYFEIKYFKDFHALDSSTDTLSHDYSEMIGGLCDFVLNLCPEIEGQTEYLGDAPLLLDFEVKYRLSAKLSELKSLLDVDPVRIDYIITSIEHLVTFSGNLQNWNDANGKWKQEQIVQIKPQQETFQDSAMIEKISMIQDLFPDLGDGFIQACIVGLKDTELIIMKLLEDDLPDYLKKMDRSLKRSSDIQPEPISVPVIKPQEIFEPKPEILSTRRNIFDGDQFDVFAHTVDPSKVQIGKKEPVETEHDRLEFLKSQREKILATQYDDDEYDDTYDSVDFLPASNEDVPADRVDSKPDPIEKKLVEMYNINEAIFHQSQRKSLARQALVKQTGWSNEQIEGWYIMLNRNPKKDLVLQKYEFRGNKHVEDESTSDEKVQEPVDVPATSSPSSSPKRGRGGYRGRGRGKDARLKKLSKGMN
ncbi:hypothetical protein HK103_004716 [Boothiomyces macroporosus]|uniref:CUE domain-containing protein n=1 Tax=Boothiomyces macroporosus TaxID=261099 RepID=A0AAD5Y8C6_9FUNG|nr:hypothetical protein HK103_004716 [Boothiomyces macroporosus]